MAGGALNILITAGSRRVALVRAFQSALRKLGVTGNVVTTDINPLSPALYISDGYHWAPLTTDPEYLKHLLEICREEKIRVLIPTIDDELEILGSARERFAAGGVDVIVSPPYTSKVCNDKWETYRFFRERKLPIPETWLPPEMPPLTKLKYPLFLKPRKGRGSVNTFRINTEKELLFFIEYVGDCIVQKYLEGPEYTLDTFVDKDGTVIAVVPRHRLWVRAGVMDKGRTEKRTELIELGARVAEELEIVGPANIQVKYTDKQPMVFEVNPRFSGGIPLTLAAGVDFAELTLRMVLGEKLRPMLGEFFDGLVMMSYEENIFRVMDTTGFGDIKKLIT
jgi:carbamoyl-phosphate synthase large subunit